MYSLVKSELRRTRDISPGAQTGGPAAGERKGDFAPFRTEPLRHFRITSPAWRRELPATRQPPVPSCRSSWHEDQTDPNSNSLLSPGHFNLAAITSVTAMSATSHDTQSRAAYTMGSSSM